MGLSTLFNGTRRRPVRATIKLDKQAGGLTFIADYCRRGRAPRELFVGRDRVAGETGLEFWCDLPW